MGLVSIPFNPADYQLIKNGQQNAADLFKQLILNQSSYQSILAHLQNYHSDEDGAPVVPSFDIAGITYDSGAVTGQIRFAYQVDFTFACADHRSSTKHIETSNFSFDIPNQTLGIFIHDKISRDTFDEF